MEPPKYAPGALVAAVTDAVANWPEVRHGDHHFGGRAFSLGGREFGHVHRSGLVDVNFGRVVRDALVADGRATPHAVHPDSGWASVRVRDPADVARATWLLRLSYLATAITLARTRTGKRALATVDLGAELDALEVPPAVRESFARRAGVHGIAL